MDDDGHPVAGPAIRKVGDPLLQHRSFPAEGGALDETARALLDELGTSCDELLVLDAERVKCRGAAPGVRLLTAWRDDARGLTAEHWLVEGDERLHVLAAVMEADRYAGDGPALRTSLATFRHDREHSFATGPDAVAPQPAGDVAAALSAPAVAPHSDGDVAPVISTVLELEVFEGRHQGLCVAVVEGALAAVQLPGEDAPRRLPSSLLPGWLAGLVGLAPRPRPACPGVLVLDRDRLDALLGLDEGSRGDEAAVRDALGPDPLPEAWSRALATLPGAVTGRWRLARRLDGMDGEVVGSSEVEVLDAGDAGLWQVVPVDEDWVRDELAGQPAPARLVALSATTPTAVWELLTS